MPARNEFDEEACLQLNADVAGAVLAGVVGSGWQHFTWHGFREGRPWVRRTDPLVGVSCEIAEGDTRFRENEAHDFEDGESALHAIESALFAACRPAASVQTILDLPCGDGRRDAVPAKGVPSRRFDGLRSESRRRGILCADVWRTGCRVARAAMDAGRHQYAVTWGAPVLREAWERLLRLGQGR